MKANCRNAFTLVELLVMIAIFGILIAIFLPSIGRIRESARRFQCGNNLTQLIIAVHNYESVHEVYPPGVTDQAGPILTQPKGYHHGWLVQILPFLDHSNLFRDVDFDESVYHDKHELLRQRHFPNFWCSTADATKWNDYGASSCYAAVHHDTDAPIDVDNNGVFFLNSRVRFKDVTDGVAHTMFLGEKPIYGEIDLSWMSGTHATLRNAGQPLRVDSSPAWGGGSFSPTSESYDKFPVWATNGRTEATGGISASGFGSYHQLVTPFAFGDGRVGFLRQDIELKILQQLAHRSDGKLIERRTYEY